MGENFFQARPGQKLEDHLKGVAERAAEFTAVFESEQWGRLAGLWHDIGKYQAKFQQRLTDDSIRVDHSGVGAVLAHKAHRRMGLPLAMAIAGHHAGLPNPGTNSEGGVKPLDKRLQKNESILEKIERDIPHCILHQTLPELPAFLRRVEGRSADAWKRVIEMWTRFLFSAPIDADRLDAEAAGSSETTALREGG